MFTLDTIRAGALAAAGLLISLAPSVAGAALVGPTSKLYLDAQSSNLLHTVQGANVVDGPAPAYCNHCESAIAVFGDVRSYSGGQYTTGLAKTGTTYAASLPFEWQAQVRDGATDGTHNYGIVRRFDGATVVDSVIAFDRDWGQPQTLFNLSSDRTATGITYDPATHSLWLQGVVHVDRGFVASIMNFELDGDLLGEFENLGGGSLALDYADGTLWSVRGPTQFFDQYSRSGQWLQTVSYQGLAGQNSVGAEFDLAAAAVPVPLPGSLPLAAVAGLAILAVRRSRVAQRTER